MVLLDDNETEVGYSKHRRNALPERLQNEYALLMTDWTEVQKQIINSAVIAAAVSGVVALLVAAISARVTRKGWAAQADLKMKELNSQAILKAQELDSQATLKANELRSQARLKAQELDSQSTLKANELELMVKRLKAEEEAVRQSQLTEIVKKRMETYPSLYKII